MNYLARSEGSGISVAISNSNFPAERQLFEQTFIHFPQPVCPIQASIACCPKADLLALKHWWIPTVRE